MKIDWKLLSYAMIVSVGIIWICALIISVLFIQPLLDMWKDLPQILSGLENHSTTIAVSGLPRIPLWVLLVVSLFLWGVMTIIFYKVMNYLGKK